jgi:transcriptional regulator with GAF, ATPase, and Fis domain
LRRGGDRSLKHDLEAVERSNIRHALEESDWKVKGEGNAASRLGLKPSTLRSRMRKLEITKPRVPD